MNTKINAKNFYIEPLSLQFLKGNQASLIFAQDEIHHKNVSKYYGWDKGDYKILDVTLAYIGYGLPKKFLFSQNLSFHLPRKGLGQRLL